MALYQISNGAGRIEADFQLYLAEYALETYTKLNRENFSDQFFVPAYFTKTVNMIYDAHKQKRSLFIKNVIDIYLKRKQNNKVLLACSGGLDSVYQAICLKEQGYDVILFHAENLNYYTNGKEKQITEECAKKLGLPLITCKFITNSKKDNPFRKFWSENSFKNMLLYSIMMDCMIKEDIYNISSGDDLSLDISKAVVGTNLSDARQITETFFTQLREYYDFKFIPTEQNHKGIRLAKLDEYGLLDTYYSCVNPGRFNQQNHKRTEDKFGVKLYQNNCGVCRKCAFHNLLRHYYLGEDFSQEFINFCWEKIANGADNVFFNKNIPLEERIKNLYEY